MSQVAPGGEVIALDTAGYGTFTISQSVSVFAAPGVTAFIAVTAGTGINITAGVADLVVLRGLALSANGGGVGIDFQTGLWLSVESCIINGFSLSGILLNRAADTSNPSIRVDHSVIRNTDTGIRTNNSGAGTPGGAPPPGVANLTVTNSSLSENGTALRAGDNTRAAVTDTVLSGNSKGVFAETSIDYAAPDVNLARCTISQNETGIQAGFGTGAVNHGVVRIAHNLITGNVTGVLEAANGKIMTLTSAGMATNTIEGNVTNGTFTGTYTGK